MKKFWMSFILTAILLLAGLYGIERSNYISSQSVVVREITGTHVTETEMENIEVSDSFNVIETGRDEIVVLLMGVDRDPDTKLENQGVSLVEKKMKELRDKGSDSFYFTTNNRSDVLYIAKFNKKTGQINMMSVPRDLRANIGRGGGVQKINAAYSYYGPYGTLDALRNFTKVDIEYFVVFDYGAVANLIDAMGGVDFDVPVNMNYEDPYDNPPLQIHLSAGLQHLNGADSVRMLRFRNSYANGDYDRIKVQQNFIKEFFKQTLSVNNIHKLPSIINKGLEAIYTNVPMDEVYSVISHAENVDVENIRLETLPGEGQYIDNISYFIHYQNKSREMILDLFGDNLIQ